MRRIITIVALLGVFAVGAQDVYKGKFEQMDDLLPTPNAYRTGSGEPGPNYWQQQADYVMELVLDDTKQRITGTETITYYNNSPTTLKYVWLQLDQNMRSKNSDTPKVSSRSNLPDTLPARFYGYYTSTSDFEGGFNIEKVVDENGKDLKVTINKTMMRIDLPTPLKTGEQVVFSIDWWYNINNRLDDFGRSGYEYFPEDDNYLYTIAQFFPRMAVYDDFNGWQHKQFLGQGEFALVFGNYNVKITAPADHVVGASGELQNESEVLTSTQMERLAQAKQSYEKPVIIITEEEAIANESSRSSETKTWHYVAKNVRDFAFISSRKFIWDAQKVKLDTKEPMAMSYYPKEGNPLWEEESTRAVANTLITYSRMSIEYPYPVAISVHTASIGMEYPMICFNYGRPNPDGTYSDQKKWGMIGVIVHEVGHNFFPMIVNSDERQWTWMDEGLNTFLETVTEMEWYPDMPIKSGTPSTITNYMSGEKDFIRPIMTNSEQVVQFGNNAYSKPSAALMLLRETVMGRDLFDYAFKEYSTRWAFKHPKPADFFRTMEDASAVDLDWFWRGWFYTTDYVDINLASVKWYKVQSDEEGFENRVTANPGILGANSEEVEPTDFSGGYSSIVLTDTPDGYYGEFKDRKDDEAIRTNEGGKNVYHVTFRNEGGLVSPIEIEWTYADGSKEIEFVPAEIWRMNERETKKVFVKEKEVVNMVIDPNKTLADANDENNFFPKKVDTSKFDEFVEEDPNLGKKKRKKRG
ncbi:MAG: M1 family metallopeptidase [Cyclobacteriaceae bacterium]